MFQFGGLQADRVVLYGGGTLMPWVKSIVMDGFATKKVFMCDNALSVYAKVNFKIKPFKFLKSKKLSSP